MEWAKRLNFLRRSALGNYMEPALTAANMTMQTMLSPPFEFPWNTTNFSFTCTPGTQDYTINIPNFGFISHASIQDPTTSKWLQLSINNTLSLDSTAGARPEFIGVFNQTSSTGDIIFRLMPAPNKAYVVTGQVSNAAPLLTGVTQTWAPIPDYVSYIYNWGFLSFMYMFSDDPRFAVANQKFIAHLLASQEGMSENQKNIFLNSSTVTSPSQKMRMSQGVQAIGI